MRLLTLGEVFALHRRILADTGGAPGVRDLNAIASAVSQQRISAGGADAYPTLIEKAAALAYSLVRNHGFIDGNNASPMPPWRCFWCSMASRFKHLLTSKND